MARNSSILHSRALTYAIPALAVVLFLALYMMGMELQVVLILTVVGIVGMALLSRSSFELVAGAVLIAIFVNMGGYSFLSHSIEGHKVTSGGQLLVSAAVPVMLLGCLTVLMGRHLPQLSEYLGRNWDVLLFAIVSVASTAFAFNVVKAFQYVMWFSASLLVGLIFWYFVSKRFPMDRCGMFVSAILFVGYAPFLLFAVPGVINYGGNHVAVLFGDGPFYAYAAAAIAGSVLILLGPDRAYFPLKFVRNIPSLFVSAAGLLAMVSVIFSAKRSTILALLMTAFVYMVGNAVVKQRKRGTSLFRTVAVSVVLVGVVVWAIPRAERTMMRFTRVVDSEQEDLSLQARRQIIQNSMYVFKKYPVFGVGLTNGDNATDALLPHSARSGYNLHNTFLGILVEFGAAGMLLFLIMLIRSAVFFFRIPSRKFQLDILLLGIAPALISVTEYNLSPGQALFWPLWLAILAPRIMTAFEPPPRQISTARQ